MQEMVIFVAMNTLDIVSITLWVGLEKEFLAHGFLKSMVNSVKS